MNLSSIISITGQSGLFKIVSQTKNGIIVEPLGGGRRFPVHGAQRVSSLEDISIYTYEEDMLLAEVFKKISDGLDGEEAISHKSSAQDLKDFLAKFLPNYDQERVYNSDIKKLVQWYNILHKEGLLKEEKKTEKESKAKAKPKEKKNEKKVKKPANKKSAATKTNKTGAKDKKKD